MPGSRPLAVRLERLQQELRSRHKKGKHCPVLLGAVEPPQQQHRKPQQRPRGRKAARNRHGRWVTLPRPAHTVAARTAEQWQVNAVSMTLTAVTLRRSLVVAEERAKVAEEKAAAAEARAAAAEAQAAAVEDQALLLNDLFLILEGKLDRWGPQVAALAATEWETGEFWGDVEGEQEAEALRDEIRGIAGKLSRMQSVISNRVVTRGEYHAGDISDFLGGGDGETIDWDEDFDD